MTDHKELLARVKEYLSVGGLFNPESMHPQNAVRNLIIDLETAIREQAAQIKTERDRAIKAELELHASREVVQQERTARECAEKEEAGLVSDIERLCVEAEATEAKLAAIERENRELKEGWRQAKIAVEAETIERCANGWYALLPVTERYSVNVVDGMLEQDNDGPWALRADIDFAIRAINQSAAAQERYQPDSSNKPAPAAAIHYTESGRAYKASDAVKMVRHCSTDGLPCPLPVEGKGPGDSTCAQNGVCQRIDLSNLPGFNLLAGLNQSAAAQEALTASPSQEGVGELTRALASAVATDEQGRPLTYWGGMKEDAGEPVAYLYTGRDTNKVHRQWSSVSNNDHWPIDQWEKIKQELLYLKPTPDWRTMSVSELAAGNPAVKAYSDNLGDERQRLWWTLIGMEHAAKLFDGYTFGPYANPAYVIRAEKERMKGK